MHYGHLHTNSSALHPRLSTEDLEHLNEDGELWFAYEGLKKATRLVQFFSVSITPSCDLEDKSRVTNFTVQYWTSVKEVNKHYIIWWAEQFKISWINFYQASEISVCVSVREMCFLWDIMHNFQLL